MRAILFAAVGVGAVAAGAGLGLGESDAGGAEYSGPQLATAADFGDGFGMVQDAQTGSTIMQADHPLLKLVQRYESGGRYDVLYGGATFASYADHPFAALYQMRGGAVYATPGGDWSMVPIITKGVNAKQHSTAAGRYQIMARTWVGSKDRFGCVDFSPASQDQFAFGLLADCGALALYNRGDLSGAISRAARVWTSLPGSNTGEAQLTLARAVTELQGLAA